MTAKKQTALHNGHVTINLAGDERELVPSLDALVKLSRMSGGLTGLLEKLRNMDADAYALVIRVGCDLSEKETKGIADKIFRAGIINLMGPLSEYVMTLARGGKPLGDDSDDGEGGEGNA